LGYEILIWMLSKPRVWNFPQFFFMYITDTMIVLSHPDPN
jgi:hypothetical protein